MNLLRALTSTIIKVENAYDCFTTLLETYQQIKNVKIGIDDNSFISKTSTYGEDIYLGRFAFVGENVKIGNNVKIYPQAYIGDNCIIGDNTIIYAGAKIYSNTQIGDNCIIHSNTTLGADGFGFAPNKDGSYKKIPQIGGVLIEKNVEIGAGSCIDRATMGNTIIREGVKIDNLVQIAHNVEIGKDTVIVSQVGIAGSSKIGKNCTLAGQAGIIGHIKIGDKSLVGAQAGVTSNVPEGKSVLGSPAMDFKETKRMMILMKNLSKLYNRVGELEKKSN